MGFPDVHKLMAMLFSAYIFSLLDYEAKKQIIEFIDFS
jgi:hypothetical protein